MPANTAADHDVDLAAEHRLERFHHGQEIVEAAVLREIDQEVDVAVRGILTSHCGAEDADVFRAMLRGDGEERISMPLQVFEYCLGGCLRQGFECPPLVRQRLTRQEGRIGSDAPLLELAC